MKLISFALLAISCGQLSAAVTPPNILIFLADDLGYADIGVNGCKDIPTPHIDSIAKNGVRFTDGYATHCVCSPSRAGLMSGMYQHRFGFEHNSGPERFAADNFGMPREIPSLAEKLKAAGYAAGMVGKWHIGFKEGLRPHERGFDHHFGFLSGARTYLPGRTDNDPILRNGVPVKTTKYLTDEFADEAVAFIERSKAQSWFLYFPFNAVHAPMDANPYAAAFTGITDAKRKTFAGMLSGLDTAVGRVLAKVRELGQEDNTLVFFYSDNGGPTAETTSRNDPLRGFKGQFYEGGIRVPFLMQWKSKVQAGVTCPQPVMAFDIHATALGAATSQSPITPEDRATGKSPLHRLDGVNLLPFLTGETSGPPHAQLFWRAGATHAARAGDWKLVVERAAGAQLFNLKADLGEQTNLAAKEPAKLAELQSAFAAWEKQMMPAQWVRQDARNADAGGKKKSSAAAPAGTAPPPASTPAAGRGMARVDAAFKVADKNNDGKLTREEYPQPANFKDVDANGDGFVTLEEVRAYYAGRNRPAAPTPATPQLKP